MNSNEVVAAVELTAGVVARLMSQKLGDVFSASGS
jgi:hypothetical protein